MPDESTRKPPGAAAGRPEPSQPEKPGHLAEDDRGNITWQWADDDSLQSDDTAGAVLRLRALVDPALDVVEDVPGANHPIDNPLGLKVGYDPYESGSLNKTVHKKKRDLRELSKWIEKKRAVEGGDKPPQK